MTRIAFAGTPSIAASILRQLIENGFKPICCLTQPDRPKGRGQKIQSSPVKEVAIHHQIPVLQPEKLNDQSIQNELACLQLDLMIVVAYGLLLPQRILNLPRLGCLNIHASLLPRFRGAAPIQRAIMEGDQTTGVCLMKMDVGLDTGPLYGSFECPILPTETSQTLHDKLAMLGGHALIETLPQILAGTLSPSPQDETQATYAAKITKAEGLVDWTKSAVLIERQIRAMQPWPMAYFHHQNMLIKVYESKVLEQDSNLRPGTIVNASKDGLDIATGQYCLRLLRIQLPGKRPLSIQDILNSKSSFFTKNTQLTC